MINGMYWDYSPIGTNFSYNLWNRLLTFGSHEQDDFLFAGIISEEGEDVDNNGVNMHRGVSFGAAFQRVMDEFNKPIMFT